MNFIVRLPRLQPVTDCTASVAHRSISTNTISVFRSAPFGSPMPAFLRPSMDILTPRTWPGQRCPWIRANSLRSVSNSIIFGPSSDEPEGSGPPLDVVACGCAVAAVVAERMNISGKGIEPQPARLNTVTAAAADACLIFGKGGPQSLRNPEQREKPAHRTEDIAPDPPRQEKLRQQDHRDQDEFGADRALLDEPGGLRRYDARRGQEVGEGKARKRRRKKDHCGDRGARARPCGGREHPLDADLARNAIDPFGQGVLRTNPAAEDPSGGQG